MKTSSAVVMLAGCALSVIALSGCVGHQTVDVAMDTGQELLDVSERSLIAGSEMSGMWEIVLAELHLQALNKERIEREPDLVSMPQLVAGDWLAFECAIAGGYWDLGYEKGTPVFAEVPESWSIPE
jgi:hypothetical protein